MSTHNFYFFLFVFGRSGFFIEMSNCLQLPELLWCPIQELELLFGVDGYSASTHNFVVFVHFSKLTHKCALFVKE